MTQIPPPYVLLAVGPAGCSDPVACQQCGTLNRPDTACIWCHIRTTASTPAPEGVDDGDR
jgi:hypothetical protein